jgi:hypothetical protein
VTELLKPVKGGFPRPFGCGWFIREFLLGKGPEGSIIVDPSRGAAQSDVCYAYKEGLARATARERSEKIVSDKVLKGADITEKQAEELYQRELTKVSRKFTHMRYHSFLMYFGMLKKLGWVELTGEVEDSSIKVNYPEAPGRIYYRLTRKGIEAPEALWSNPFFALYPEHGPSHNNKSD